MATSYGSPGRSPARCTTETPWIWGVLHELEAAGLVTLADTAEGLRRVEHGHARGKVIITVA